jgi:cytoplasmic iron level regulating protein YaaA (DUF328/UPF0246 family)
MVVTKPSCVLTTPIFDTQATELRRYIAGLSTDALQKMMHISAPLAKEVGVMYTANETPSAAIESFRGDIFSGARALEWTPEMKEFAQQHLRLLSGLYGVLKPYDAVQPYRLEAAYKLPDEAYRNLYTYWGDTIAKSIDGDEVLDLTSKEYSKLVAPRVRNKTIVAPIFLSRPSKGAEPVFVAVHAKIARGAFARWVIARGKDTLQGIESFDDLGYQYDSSRSQPGAPVYICDDFKGLGLSQRKKV